MPSFKQGHTTTFFFFMNGCFLSVPCYACGSTLTALFSGPQGVQCSEATRYQLIYGVFSPHPGALSRTECPSVAISGSHLPFCLCCDRTHRP